MRPGALGAGDNAYSSYLTGHTFWLATNGDCERVRRCLVIFPWLAAVCKDLPHGLRANAMQLLAQLNFYFRVGNDNKIRARRVKRRQHIWVAKTRAEWAKECFLSPTQVRRALEALLQKGFVVRMHGRF